MPLNPVNFETVLLSEEVDLNEKLFKKSFPDLDFFPELLPNYFQNNNKDFSILHLNI